MYHILALWFFKLTNDMKKPTILIYTIEIMSIAEVHQENLQHMYFYKDTWSKLEHKETRIHALVPLMHTSQQDSLYSKDSIKL